MSEHFVIELARRTIATIAMMAAPTIGAVMIVGILVNIVQTITQI